MGPAGRVSGRPAFVVASEGMAMDQDRRELVMFDFDGVIVDSLDVFSAAFSDACAAAGVPGFTTPDELLAVMEDNFYAGMRARGVDDARVAEVLRRLGEALIRARHWLKPFPLVPEVLEDLADARTVVIVTSSPTDVVEGWLRTHEVHGVAEVAGAETARSKVEKIHTLLARFPGQEVYWYVGDTAGDIREAREAGVTPVGVAWGWHDPELLVEAGAERIAASPAELLGIVAPELTRDFFGAG
jgi:phosphoglycolate phosphatase